MAKRTTKWRKTRRLAQENNRQENKTRYNDSLGGKNIKSKQKEEPDKVQTNDNGWKKNVIMKKDSKCWNTTDLNNHPVNIIPWDVILLE